MTDRTVKEKVWDKPHTIDVYQKSKTVWVAAGEYMGEQIQFTDRTWSAVPGDKLRRNSRARRTCGRAPGTPKKMEPV
jgi:hypothetical protein